MEEQLYFNFDYPDLSQASNYHTVEKASITHLQDSGYTSVVGSCLVSNRSSRQPSRCVSPSRHKLSRLASPRNQSTAPSTQQSRCNSRKSSPTRACELSKSDNDFSHGMSFTLDNGVKILLSDSNIAGQLLMKPLSHKELTSARKWLSDLDWASYDHYQDVQEEIETIEEEFSRSFACDPPTFDCDDDEGYSDLLKADAIVSMVDAAWNIEIHADYLSDFNQHDMTKMGCLTIDIPSTPTQVCNEPLKKELHNHSVIPSELNDHKFLQLVQTPGCSKTVHEVKREDALFNIRYKTQPCVHFQKLRQCPAGDNCHFAHGPEELRRPTQHPKFKTQVCAHFAANGKCPYGNRCFFQHSLPDLSFHTDRVTSSQSVSDDNESALHSQLRMLHLSSIKVEPSVNFKDTSSFGAWNQRLMSI